MKRKTSIFVSILALGWAAFGLGSLASADDSVTGTPGVTIGQLESELRSKGGAGLNPARLEGFSVGQGARPNSTNARPAGIETVMDELVFHFRFLKRRAEEKNRKGQNSQGLLEYYKRKLKLSDAENNALTAVLAAADASVKATDEQLRHVTRSYRDQVRNGVPAGQRTPKIPANLRALAEQRDSFLSQLPSTLRARMGDAGFEKLNLFLMTEVAPRIRTNTLQDHGTFNPRPSGRAR